MDQRRIMVTMTCGCGRRCLTSDECVSRREKRGLAWRCRSCAMRERAGKTAFPAAVKERAKLLRARGYGVREITRHLADEQVHIAESTISMWTRTHLVSAWRGRG